MDPLLEARILGLGYDTSQKSVKDLKGAVSVIRGFYSNGKTPQGMLFFDGSGIVRKEPVDDALVVSKSFESYYWSVFNKLGEIEIRSLSDDIRLGKSLLEESIVGEFSLTWISEANSDLEGETALVLSGKDCGKITMKKDPAVSIVYVPAFRDVLSAKRSFWQFISGQLNFGKVSEKYADGLKVLLVPYYGAKDPKSGIEFIMDSEHDHYTVCAAFPSGRRSDHVAVIARPNISVLLDGKPVTGSFVGYNLEAQIKGYGNEVLNFMSAVLKIPQ